MRDERPRRFIRAPKAPKVPSPVLRKPLAPRVEQQIPVLRKPLAPKVQPVVIHKPRLEPRRPTTDRFGNPLPTDPAA